MKNLSLILNGVLLVAVGILYFLHFSGKNEHTSTGGSMLAPGNLALAYINSDSVLEHYEYLREQRSLLEAKGTKMDSEYRNRAQGLQNEISAYQRNVNNMTYNQQRGAEEELTRKQQNLELYQQSLSQELMIEQNKLNKELYDRITSFLKDYGKQRGLQLVLKFDPTSDVLYAGDSLEITQAVIDGLNTLYKDEKGGVKADSIKAEK